MLQQLTLRTYTVYTRKTQGTLRVRLDCESGRLSVLRDALVPNSTIPPRRSDLLERCRPDALRPVHVL